MAAFQRPGPTTPCIDTWANGSDPYSDRIRRPSRIVSAALVLCVSLRALVGAAASLINVLFV